MPKRIFISFAVEDVTLRDFLRGQSRLGQTPFQFTDFSVKEPWDSNWKSHCRQRIKGCSGAIAIITSNTPRATGQLWEIKCAHEEGIPVLMIYGNDTRPATSPPEIKGRQIRIWTWDAIRDFIARV